MSTDYLRGNIPKQMLRDSWQLGHDPLATGLSQELEQPNLGDLETNF
jgi:hypothetical protein